MSLKITSVQFSELVAKAKRGEAEPLHRFLGQLYRKGKHSLLGLTGSELDAEEYFAVAVAKFWEKFVVGQAPLPEVNIGGYIYTMAKFLCLDQKRNAAKTPVSKPIESLAANQIALAETPKTAKDFQEEESREQKRKEAMRRGIARLGDNCRQLFQTILETGLEKPRELFTTLGLKDARAVAVLRYECTRQLKVKAAKELEMLIQEGNSR